MNCAAGVSRSATVWVAFVALFGVKCLADSDESSNPNGILTPYALLDRDTSQLVDELARYLK